MKKKIISILLVLTMILPLCCFLTGCEEEESEGYITPTNSEPLYEFKEDAKTLIREDADETKNTTFTLVEENDNYELYFSSEILEVALKSKESGEVWYSNPTPSEREAGIKSEMSSQLILFYLNKTDGSQKTLESFLDCLMNESDESELHQYYVVNHNGHLRVIYILGQVKPDYVIPTCLDEETALSYIETLKNTPGYLAVSKYISGGSVYSKITPAVWDTYPSDRQQELTAIAPEISSMIDEGKTVYIIGDKKTWNKSRVMQQLQEAFVNVIGLTVAQRDEINEQFGVEAEAAKNFWIPVDYTLTENGLNVNIPNDEIQYDKSSFAIANIKLLQYFGSASQSEQGYMFVPDGSGALINFNNGKTNIKSDVRVQIYGIDDGREKNVEAYDNESAYLPVFGIKKENSAMFAVIKSGDCNATVIADIAGKSTNSIDRNKVYTSFTLSEYEELQFKNSGKSSRIYQNEQNSADLTIEYTILNGDKADYNGMAEYYRNYLIENGILTKKDYSNITFNIELVGAYDHDTAFLGVSYTEMKALTTFEQCGELLQKLSDAGIKNVSVNYKGWANNGLRNTCYNRVKVLKALGGKNGLNELMTLADSLGMNIYFETELAFVYETEMFDGFSSLTQAARLVTRDIEYHYSYEIDWKTQKEEGNAIVVAPSVIYDIDSEDNSKSNTLKLNEDLNKLNIKSVSLGSLGWNLPGSYKVKDLTDRSKTAATYSAVAEKLGEDKSVMAKGVNGYLLKYVDSIFEISNTSSKFNLADESIPFYQMVIHGCIEYSGEPINLNGDARLAFLQAVEAGSGMYYRWCYAANDEVQDLDFEGMYSLSYSSWFDDAVEMYKEYNDLLASTAGEYMVKHETVAENVKKVTYANGVSVYVNYNSFDYTADDGTVVKAEAFAKGGVK